MTSQNVIRQSRLSFFATEEDIKEKFSTYELPHWAKIVMYGSQATADIIEYSSIVDIPECGFSRTGNMVAENQYWLVKRSAELSFHESRPPNGEAIYCIDPVGVDHVALIFGGVFNDWCMISSEVTVLSADQELLLLQKDIAARLRKGSKRVGSYWIAPHALELYKSGVRFTPSVESTITIIDFG